MCVPQVDKPQCPNPNKEDKKKETTTFNARYEEVLTLWSVADFLSLFSSTHALARAVLWKTC